MSYRDNLESSHRRIAQPEGELRYAKGEPIARAVAFQLRFTLS